MVHIHFENDDAMGEEESAPLTTRVDAYVSEVFKLPRCCNFASVGGAYVFRVSCNSSCDAITASTSDNIIKAYSLSSSQLAHVCDLRGHSGSITDVAFTASPSMLHSSSVDGTIRGWDLRTAGQAERLVQYLSFSIIYAAHVITDNQHLPSRCISSFASQQELHSFSVLEHLLAVGGQGEVFLWDRRSPGKPLLTLPDTHMEDVTQVFIIQAHNLNDFMKPIGNPRACEILRTGTNEVVPIQVKLSVSQHMISASTDGLVAVHDYSRGFVEDDDSFTAALNVGTSVEEMGIYGKEGEKLWVRTGTESLLLWEWRLATLGDLEGGDEAFAHWPEARTTAVAAASGSPAASLFEEVIFSRFFF